MSSEMEMNIRSKEFASPDDDFVIPQPPKVELISQGKWSQSAQGNILFTFMSDTKRETMPACYDGV